MQMIAFENNGLIDIRAFTMFGVNSKPNSVNPIGFFGTGLKYAIAVLARHRIKMRLFIGDVEYEFYVKDDKFRGKDFEFIMMKRRKGFLSKWKYEQLPFTTELGKKWELWQAYRELESNVRDEGGHSFLIDEDESSGMSFLNDTYDGKTVIIVEGQKFVDVWHGRSQVFLDEAEVVKSSAEDVQVLRRPSKHIYYRGLRVMDLEKPSAFTYNILGHLDLTEDRTVKYEFYVINYLVNHIMRTTDADLIDKVLKLNEEEHYEGKLDFDTSTAQPSETFVAALGTLKANKTRILPRADTFYGRYYAVTSDPKKKITIEIDEDLAVQAQKVLEQIDLYNPFLREKLGGWDEEDERFNGFVRLRDTLHEKLTDDGIPF